MSYNLEFMEPIPNGIKRIITEQVDKTLYSLTESDESLEERIHDARKRFKKIRAVLRLVRDEIGEDSYQMENVTYRDAGRLLAPLRDSDVAVQTLDALIDHFSDELDASTFDPLRQRLLQRHEDVCQQAEADHVVQEVVTRIEEARTRIETLPVVHDDFSALHDGLRRVYKRGYKRMGDAYDACTPESFHEWRKRIKYLWYHMRILEILWADILDEFGDAVHDLADYLGDAHDFADFEALIRDEPDLVENKETGQVLDALAKRRRNQLQNAAQPLAQRIYAEAPDTFMDRIATYWEVTKLEVEQKASGKPSA